MKTYTDQNFKIVNASTIEAAIDFTREQYCEKMEARKNELVSFDKMLQNIVDNCHDFNGTFEDAVFDANDVFLNL